MKALRGIVVILILASSAYLWAGFPAHAKGGGFVAETALTDLFEEDVVGQIQLQQFDETTAVTTPATLTPSAKPWAETTKSYAVTGSTLLLELKLFDGNSGTLATGRISLSSEANSLETRTTTPATLTGEQAEEIEHYNLLVLHTGLFVIGVGAAIFLGSPAGVEIAAGGFFGIIIEVKELVD